MDIIRNVGIREIVGGAKATDPLAAINGKNSTNAASNPQLHRNSMPNLVRKESEKVRPAADAYSTTKLIQPSSVKVYQDVVHHNRNGAAAETGPKKKSTSKIGNLCASDVDDNGEECAVSGRLEIRVVQQQQKSSPNREESVYFDAVANANSNMTSTDNAPDGNDEQTVPRKSVNRSQSERTPRLTSSEMNATAIESGVDAETDDAASHSRRKYVIVASNDRLSLLVKSNDMLTRVAPTGSNESNYSKSVNIENIGGGGGGGGGDAGDDNAPDTTFVSAATTLPKFSPGIDDDDVGIAVSSAICNANNDSLSNNDNNKENPVISYSSLYPNQSSLEQMNLTAMALVTTKPPPTPVAAPNQSDGTCSSNVSLTSTNQMNNKKDINSSTSCSKIPIFNPTNVRMLKCASWAGSDLPLTPAEMNNLTPGK